MSATVFFEHANELATLTNTFSVSGAATDPTTISLTVTTPSGVATTYTHAGGTITKSATGVYTKDVACAESGVWLYLWVGTGAASDAVAGTWVVHDPALQHLYCTPEMFKNRVGIDDNLDDGEILPTCRAISRWIDKHCGQFFYRHTATRHLKPCNLYLLDVPALVSVTTLKTDASGDGTFETTWTTADYQLLPVDAPSEVEAEPYRQIRAVGSYTFPIPYWTPNTRDERVQIAGVWGWPAVPEDVTEAAKIFVTDFLKVGKMTFGVQSYGDYGAIRARLSGPGMQLIDNYVLDKIKVG